MRVSGVGSYRKVRSSRTSLCRGPSHDDERGWTVRLKSYTSSPKALRSRPKLSLRSGIWLDGEKDHCRHGASACCRRLSLAGQPFDPRDLLQHSDSVTTLQGHFQRSNHVHPGAPKVTEKEPVINEAVFLIELLSTKKAGRLVRSSTDCADDFCSACPCASISEGQFCVEMSVAVSKSAVFQRLLVGTDFGRTPFMKVERGHL